MDRPNLTVLTEALVTRLLFRDKNAVGVEFSFDGKIHRISAECEVVLSLGAINTPKVLMQSGIGDESELQRFGIPLLQHLAGVGRNFQDHVNVASCIWEYPEVLDPQNNRAEATLFWKSSAELDTPDLQLVQGESLLASAEIQAQFNPPADSWSLFPWLAGVTCV